MLAGWLSAGVSPLPRCRIVESPIILYRAVEALHLLRLLMFTQPHSQTVNRWSLA